MTVRMPVTTLGPGGPVVSRIGMGLAALGRPAYITTGRAHDLTDRSVPAMRARTFCVLDAAYDGGVRYVDAARSYGRAEDFLAGSLADRAGFSVAQWAGNFVEPSVAPAAAEAAAAGWTILVNEVLANGRLAPGGDGPGPPAPLAALAAAREVTPDAIAIAAALANPWAGVVLAGAGTGAQLPANPPALARAHLPPPDLPDPPRAYRAAP